MDVLEETVSHWSDTSAAEIIKEKKADSYIVATGITPSGPIHLGNMREVLTGDAIYKSLIKLEKEAKLIYIADTFDPLRKVYPFLPQNYDQFIGRPIFEIPDPEKCHQNYAEHFLSPFLSALKELGIHPEVLRAHELYKSGRLAEVTATALKSRDKIKHILEQISGRQLPKDWWPFQARCKACGRISSTKIIEFDENSMAVTYLCECGNQDTASIKKGEGKMPWRVDWPARWKALGVLAEPFGKDHAASGGSHDTAVKISREIFDYEPPYPTIYEWIYLKGQGAMASSTGVGISIQQLLSVIRPEIIRYLILRSKPDKHIDFDPSQGLLKLADDYDKLEESYFKGTTDNWEKRTYELCQTDKIPEKPNPHIPLDHLAIAIQAGLFKTTEIINILRRTGYVIAEKEIPFLEDLIKRTTNWLKEFAPSGFKFDNPDSVTPDVDDFSDQQLDFLAGLSVALKDSKWNAESIHSTIHEVSKEMEISQKNAFQAIYLALIGQKHGPRAGWFLSSLEKDFAISRFTSMAQAKNS